MKINVTIDIDEVVAGLMDEYCEEQSEDMDGYHYEEWLANNAPDKAFSKAIMEEVIKEIKGKFESKIMFEVSDGKKELIQSEFDKRLESEVTEKVAQLISDFFAQNTVTIEEGPSYNRKVKKISMEDLVVEKIKETLESTEFRSDRRNVSFIEYLTDKKIKERTLDVAKELIEKAQNRE